LEQQLAGVIGESTKRQPGDYHKQSEKLTKSIMEDSVTKVSSLSEAWLSGDSLLLPEDSFLSDESFDARTA
jgi:hypothetical protein